MHFGIFSVKTDTGRKPREKRGEKEQENKAPPLEGRTNLESDRKKNCPFWNRAKRRAEERQSVYRPAAASAAAAALHLSKATKNAPPDSKTACWRTDKPRIGAKKTA